MELHVWYLYGFPAALVLVGQDFAFVQQIFKLVS